MQMKDNIVLVITKYMIIYLYIYYLETILQGTITQRQVNEFRKVF